MSKRLSKYIASFDYCDKSLTVSSATSGGISIASFATLIEALVGIANASFRFVFTITTRIIKKLLKTARDKKKKYHKIVVLGRSKLRSIESKISELLINNKISHEDFTAIINEENIYRELKESIRLMKSQRNGT